MHKGKRLSAGQESLAAARDRAQKELAALPSNMHSLFPASAAYPVRVSQYLEQEAAQIKAALGQKE
jgi:hypothetical protein